MISLVDDPEALAFALKQNVEIRTSEPPYTRSLSKSVLFLGVPPSERLWHPRRLNTLCANLVEAEFAVSILGPPSCPLAKQGDDRGGTVIVFPSVLAVTALAKVLGYCWDELDNDLKILLARRDGIEHGELSATGATLERIFDRLPQLGDPQDIEPAVIELVAGLRVFFPTTVSGAVSAEKAKAESGLAEWFARRSRSADRDLLAAVLTAKRLGV